MKRLHSGSHDLSVEGACSTSCHILRHRVCNHPCDPWGPVHLVEGAAHNCQGVLVGSSKAGLFISKDLC